MLSIALILIALAQTLPGVSDSRTYEFDPFPMNASCGRIETYRQSRSAISREVTTRGRTMQIFTDRTTKREVFRFAIGSNNNKYWNYGIAVERDFNGDGLPDYSWYGGDDTSDEMFILLSKAGGYRKLDVYHTIKQIWARKFGGSLVITSDGDALVSLKLIRHAGKLVLKATVQKYEARHGHTVTIPEADFVYTKTTGESFLSP